MPSLPVCLLSSLLQTLTLTSPKGTWVSLSSFICMDGCTLRVKSKIDVAIGCTEANTRIIQYCVPQTMFLWFMIGIIHPDLVEMIWMPANDFKLPQEPHGPMSPLARLSLCSSACALGPVGFRQIAGVLSNNDVALWQTLPDTPAEESGLSLLSVPMHLRGHHTRVQALAFSSNGHFLASGGALLFH